MYSLVYADKDGNLYDNPNLGLLGRSGGLFMEPLAEEIITLPQGASMVMVPYSKPLGINPGGQFTKFADHPATGAEAFAVGALLPQGYTRTLLPAYLKDKKAGSLPLLGYAAVGFKGGQFYVAAMATDKPHKWDPSNYNTEELPGLVDLRVNKYPRNRILGQLAKCSLEYGCLTAQNIFYGRWEGGLPVSPQCNARCLGCISEQPAECCPSPQERIAFRPELHEVLEVALPHLQEGVDGIISFGQGCEGEPSLQAPLIAEAIREVRKITDQGTININTNAGYSQGIKEICQAGLDAMRVSLISAIPATYDAYYRPRNYDLNMVRESIKAAKGHGVYVSLNLLTMPGLNDREEETEALLELVRDTGIDLIQLRNLNIDPDQLQSVIGLTQEETLSIPGFIQALRQELPGVEIGNFSRPVAGRG